MLGGHGSQPCLNPAPYSPPLDACRAGVDTSALLVKSGLTLLLVSRTNLEPALVFSLAQIASALVTLLAYAAFTGPEVIRSLRSTVSTPPCLVPEQLCPACVYKNGEGPGDIIMLNLACTSMLLCLLIAGQRRKGPSFLGSQGA